MHTKNTQKIVQWNISVNIRKARNHEVLVFLVTVDQKNEKNGPLRSNATMYQNNRKERRMKESKGMIFTTFSRYGLLFPANKKQTEKSHLTSILWRFIDRVCSPLLFHFNSLSSLSFAHNSQDTPRHSFHKCNKRYREKRRDRRERRSLEWTPWENSTFFRWRSIITRAQTRSISGYFKLLTRRDIPKGGETSSWLSSGKFRTTDRKLIRRARIKTEAERWRQCAARR